MFTFFQYELNEIPILFLILRIQLVETEKQAVYGKERNQTHFYNELMFIANNNDQSV